MRPLVTSTDLINNIGAPFENTSAFVLDPNSDTVLPRGAVGELCFGGDQVFRGYLNRPELNATKLIDLAPFGRVYRSGDMGMLLPDDCILSTGRSDDQVKIRGQRVELGEITSLVLDDEHVDDCQTLLSSNKQGTKVLISFWTPKDRLSNYFAVLDAGALRSTILRVFETLSRRLPTYMVPSYVIPVSRIPMTAQAKIDKRLLQTTFIELNDMQLTQTAPAQVANVDSNGQMNGAKILPGWETNIAEILARVLQVDVGDITPSSSFFNLGLDSVSAIRFCNSVRRSALGDFTVAEVLRNSTISYLNAIRMEHTASTRACKTPMKQLQDIFTSDQKSDITSTYRRLGLQVEKIYPCTPLQEAMLASGSVSKAAYNNTMVFDVKGDVARIQSCWNLARGRHEILRTSFIASDHPDYAFAQVVVEDSDFCWSHLNTLDNVRSHMDEVLADLLTSNRPPLHLAVHKVGSSTKIIFSCHHALYDGTAIAVLMEEIQDAYSGCELSPAVPYSRYLQHMISQDVVEAEKFWSSRLSNFEPTYFPDLTGRVHRYPGLSKSIVRDLEMPLSVVRTASQHASVSVLAIVQAAWAKLLHFYTGEHDLCFGNVVSGRALPEDDLDSLVAPCFNTLPVRAKFDFSKSNSALVKLLHSFNLDSFAYQMTALRRIQSAALSDGARLFDTLFILQQPSKPLDDTIWTLLEDLGEMDLPIVCEIHQDNQSDALKMTLHYNTGLLSEKDARVIVEAFDANLVALIQHEEEAANGSIGFHPASRAESNMAFKELPLESKLLHKGFEQNASSLQQDVIALDFLHADGRRTIWSYKKLNLIANGIANRLIRHGVEVEDVIPIHMTKSPMFYAAVLGVLKAGAAFAPVHPELPKDRKELMVKELHAKIIVSAEETSCFSTQTSAAILRISDLSSESSSALETPYIERLTVSNLAYCLYTSGSTGVPKAVSMEHRSPVQTIEASRSLVPWDSSSRLLQYAAITFDMCYYDCFLAWTLGFTLCAAEQHVVFNDLPHVINSLDVTLLDLTPSVAATLQRNHVPSVQWMYCIGEAMSADIAREWKGACANSYGPTEAAFCTTLFSVSRDVKTSVIGQPYPTTSFAVFSPQGKLPLPKLSIGELFIGGAQLARGYLGRPKLTDERFVTRCDQRFYRSGDMVRMLSNGNFEFIGRADDQVKIRGMRVELGEINAVLQGCDTRIRSVVTQILKRDATAKEQLVAFIATHGKLENNEEVDLQRKAAQAGKRQLPAYMVPQFFIIVKSIPKSMAGKVDQRALELVFRAAGTTSGTSSSVSDSHKWTDLELDIRNVLSQLSKVSGDDILPETSIYQLGLDSISAVQISAALRKRGHNASASDVMRFTTCVDLGEHLHKSALKNTPRVEQFDFVAFDAKYRVDVLKSCGLHDRDVGAIRPCTPLQQGMVSQFIAKNGSVYYNYLRLQLRNLDMDVAKLKNAWAMTMQRHPILRTGFAHIQDGQTTFAMIQFRPDSVTLPWSEGSDGDGAYAANRLHGLQQKALTHLHQPMWDIRLNVSGEDTFLDLSIFHALFDAHSLQLIFNDVATTYNDLSSELPSSLEPVLSELLSLNNVDQDLTDSFWTDLGKKAVVSRFPNMAPLRYEPQPPIVLAKPSSMSVAEIENGCRAADITLQAAGIVSWSSILSTYTGEPSVTIGVVLSGRTSNATRDAVFPCINTVPFPCLVTAEKEVTLKSTMVLSADMHRHQFTPLNRIQKLMGLASESSFDSLFAFQKSTEENKHRQLWMVSKETATTEYPISIELELKNAGLEYRLTYLPHIVPSEQAKTILDQLDFTMRSFIIPETIDEIGCLRDPSLFSITPPKEPVLPSQVKLLHEFVEVTANEHPDRVAFEFATSIQDGHFTSKRWTYRELDVGGNRIAHLLLSYNVQQGGLVGVCFDKCPEASFAMLGILKAGCAFVAIDPSAPSTRQAFIVEDSGAQVVLSMNTQSGKFRDIVKVPVLDLDKIVTEDLPGTSPQIGRSIQSDDRSYCLYTSGTTGTPKGCELTHDNAVQAMLAFQRLFAGHWDETSRWLQFASFHFDVSVLEQYWSWSVGICVVSAPRDLIFEDIAESIRTLNITHIDLTPSLAQILHPDDVPSLCKGVFITGGESLKQEILDVWGPKSVIYNGYGPTEATIGCTMYPRVPANGKPSNIGPQFDNVGSYVLKPDSDIPVLRGGVGELCVSGKLVGKGYLNRPKLTEDRFAYLNRFEERVYRTGDLVRILHNGTFDFLGRADDQVKLRGQRLEIGEINSIIRQSSRDFADVATLVLKHPKQQKEQLVVFVVISMKPPHGPAVLLVEANKLRDAKEACQDKLPPYMVPTHFVPLASMPLNINNKADGKKLKQIFEALSGNDLQQLSTTSNGSSEAWSTQEKELRQAVAKVLSVDEEAVDKNSSFLELGMDSISVIGVSQALKKAGYLKATAATLMRYSTIGRLAKLFSTPNLITDARGSLTAAEQTIKATQHRHRRIVAQSLALDLQGIEALAPCTPLQQGMIARYLDSEYGLYFNTFTFDLTWDVDTDRLRSAYAAVFKDVQILRTVFVNTDDGYVQAVLQDITLPWTEQAVERASVPKHVQKLRRKWLEANQTDLRRPFEVHLVGESGAQVLVVHIFHGLYDGNSIGLLFGEVRRRFDCTPLEADSVPTFHHALAHGPLRAVEGARDFWAKHLASPTPMRLPSLTMEHVHGTVVVTRNLDPMPGYEVLRRRLNSTAQAIAQACWVHTLQQYSRAPITTGLVVSGRNIDLEHADRIIGPMFNTIPYQQYTRDGDTWASVVARAHDFNTASIPYQHTPLRDILKWCKRSPNQPLFDTLFVYQVTQTADDLWNNAMWTLQDDGAVADYPLAFEIEQKADNGFTLTLVTQGHMSNVQTSNELLDRFEEALMGALADPSTQLHQSCNSTKSDLNGALSENHNPSSSNGASGFDWTKDAIVIREEIASLTGIDTAEIHESTSIFEVGLDSIDSIKLSSRLKRRNINIPVSRIMRGLTIETMLKNIPSESVDNTRSEVNREFALQKEELARYVDQNFTSLSEVDDVLPLTPLQEAMVAEMMASDYTRYYNFDVAELAVGTDADRLESAWHAVIESSPILRTAFIEVDDPHINGSYAQVVVKKQSCGPRTQRKKLTIDGRPHFPSIIQDLRREAVQWKGLNPPVSIEFLETPVATYQILSIAHALYDGWSLGLLHDAVQAAYRGHPVSHPSYEATLTEILSGSGPAASTFWQNYLSGLTPSLLPRRPTEVMGTVFREKRTSETGLTTIVSFAKNSRVSLQTLGQTVFALTLASYVSSLDVTFGSVLSGRDDDERSQLLFPIMNTVAIRTVLHGTRLEMLQYVQENFNEIKQWQHFPLRKATTLAGTRGKLFDSLFIYQKSAEKATKTEEKLYGSIEGQSDVEYPVCVEMEVLEGALVWRCAVKDEVFSLEETRTLLRKLDEVLGSIIAHPDKQSVDSTSQGVSVCGLPTFREGEMLPPREKHEEKESSPHIDAPLSDTAAKIRQALAMVSQLPEHEIERDMSIFHIGLDSISAIKVSSILRKQGIGLGVGNMLKAGTVGKMAEVATVLTTPALSQVKTTDSVIEDTLRNVDHGKMLRQAGIEVAQVDRILPLTAGQTYMLSMWLNTKGANFYPTFLYGVERSVELGVLQSSWQALLETNPILRTRIIATEQNDLPYVQVALKEASASLIDVTGQNEEITVNTMNRVAMQQPWVYLFVSQNPKGWTLKLKIHHALYDGVSLPLLMQQFQDICNSASVAAPDNALDEYMACSYALPAILSRQAFWTQYLTGVGPYPSTELRSAPVSRTEIFKPDMVHTFNLEAFARQQGVSTQAFFLAAYSRLCAARTNLIDKEDVVIGVYLANRSLPIDSLPTAAIPTLNLLPLRVRSPLSTTILDAAIQIQNDLQEISDPANATASLHEISEWTGVRVETFVNFLSLPETNGESGMSRDSGVKITQETDWQEAVSRVTDIGGDDWKPPKTLVNERINAAYLVCFGCHQSEHKARVLTTSQHAIDVEATIRNGNLDVGVFAPTDMLSQADGEELIQDLKDELDRLV